MEWGEEVEVYPHSDETRKFREGGVKEDPHLETPSVIEWKQEIIGKALKCTVRKLTANNN